MQGQNKTFKRAYNRLKVCQSSKTGLETNGEGRGLFSPLRRTSYKALVCMCMCMFTCLYVCMCMCLFVCVCFLRLCAYVLCVSACVDNENMHRYIVLLHYLLHLQGHSLSRSGTHTTACVERVRRKSGGSQQISLMFSRSTAYTIVWLQCLSFHCFGRREALSLSTLLILCASELSCQNSRAHPHWYEKLLQLLMLVFGFTVLSLTLFVCELVL